MRTTGIIVLCGTAIILMISSRALASSRNPSDFPLRVHVYQSNTITHYNNNQDIVFVDGTGRANLYENGQPNGFDFSFHCSQSVMTSSGYETYPSRWKKPKAVLEILLPVMGAPNATSACELKVGMKDSKAYYTHNGLLSEEPSAVYKQWMDRVQFDPEQGKNEPIHENPPASAASGTKTP